VVEPKKLSAMAYKYMKDHSKIPQKMKLMGIRERAHKVRVASIHSCEEVQVARRVTQLWMPLLKRLRCTRHALKRGVRNDFKLERHEGDVVYSADLSKATDYFPHEVARYIASELCELTGMKEGWNEVLMNLFGPKVLISEQGELETKVGIHMGLGPSWIILCLANAFCAEAAGAARESYQVCGDDLIGSWPRTVCRGYAQNLSGLGLEENSEKSFVGRAGIFCGKFAGVSPNDPKTIWVRDLGKLSQVAASRYFDDPKSKSKLAAAQGVSRTHYKHMDGLKLKTLRRLLSRRKNVSGPVALGGNGLGCVSRGRLAGLASKRSAPLIKQSKSSSYRAATASLLERAQPSMTKSCKLGKTMKIRDALVSLQAVEDLCSAYAGSRRAPRKVSVRDHDKHTLIIRGQSDEQILKNSKERINLSAQSRRRLRWALKIGGIGGRKWASNIITGPPQEKYISRSELSSIIHTEYGLQWDSQLQEKLPRQFADVPLT
jgi:hypothetical protein